MSGRDLDSRVDAPQDRVNESQAPAEGTLLQDAMGGTKSEQLAAVREMGQVGNKAEILAPFKSQDGSDVKLVEKDRAGKEVEIKDKETYKPAVEIKGERAVSSTIGNDTQWAVSAPEQVTRKEHSEEVKEVKSGEGGGLEAGAAAGGDGRAEGKAGDKDVADKDGEGKSGDKDFADKDGDGKAEGELEGKAGDKDVADKDGDGKAEGELEGKAGDKDVADKDGDGKAEAELEGAAKGLDGDGAKENLEAVEAGQGSAEAGAEVGSERDGDSKAEAVKSQEQSQKENFENLIKRMRR